MAHKENRFFVFVAVVVVTCSFLATTADDNVTTATIKDSSTTPNPQGNTKSSSSSSPASPTTPTTPSPQSSPTTSGTAAITKSTNSTAASSSPSSSSSSSTTTTPASTTTTTTTATQAATATRTPAPTTMVTFTTKTTTRIMASTATATATAPSSASGPTSTAAAGGGSSTACLGLEDESFFGKYGLFAFVSALGLVLLLLYAIFMLLLLPRIARKSRKGRKYSVANAGRKSRDHQGVPPLALVDDEDTQSTSKATDHGPLMLVTALDSVALVSEQDNSDAEQPTPGPPAPGQGDARKGSSHSDHGNVSTFLLRQTSIREAEEKRRAGAEAKQRAEAEARQRAEVSQPYQPQDPPTMNYAAFDTTGSSAPKNGNDNLFDSFMTPSLSTPLYEKNNEMTEV